MAISQNKKEQEKKKSLKRLEKQKKKAQKKASGTDSFEDMIAYVDENGMLTTTPPSAEKEEVDAESIAISTPKKEVLEGDTTLQGRVSFFNATKGFGFITNLTSVEKYFFHISGAPQNIAEGQVVSFELERGDRGWNAVNIKN